MPTNPDLAALPSAKIMTSEEMAAAVLTSLLRQGHRADTLECLTHGDGRGTVPPNTLVNALAPIAAQLAEARQVERVAEARADLPEGYGWLAEGDRCRCIKMWSDENGRLACCKRG